MAIETVLKAVVSSIDASKIPADGFQSVVQQADKLLASKSMNSIPNQAHIQYVHTIRNDAQHKARYPGEIEVNDCRTYTRDFFQAIFQDVWGLSLDKISLTELIQNDTVRDYLVKAEESLDQSDYDQAVLLAAAAFSRTTDLARKALLGGSHLFTKTLLDQQSGPQKPSKNLYRSLERSQDALLYLALGMNYIDFVRYEKLMENLGLTVRVYDDGTFRHYRRNANQIAPAEAERAVIYCIDAVVQIESRIGNL